MSFNLNPFHDLRELGHDAETALFGSSASVPQPARFTRRALPQSDWQITRSSANGEVTIHRDVLVSTAAQINGDTEDLSRALALLRSAAPGGTTITGWPTANGFSGNVAAVNQAMSAGGGHTVAAHQAAAANLTATAANFDNAETDITRAINTIAAQLGVAS
jgi:hypothetical protein